MPYVLASHADSCVSTAWRPGMSVRFICVVQSVPE